MENKPIREPIDKRATLDRVRKRYSSVLACCREYGVSSQIFYMTVAGRRGRARRASVSKEILRRLEAEGLLVEAEAAEGYQPCVNGDPE